MLEMQIKKDLSNKLKIHLDLESIPMFIIQLWICCDNYDKLMRGQMLESFKSL